MELRADHPVCTGHMRCSVLTSKHFESGSYRIVLTDEAPRVLEEDAPNVQATRPERAISIT
jgi:hypothetical protein